MYSISDISIGAHHRTVNGRNGKYQDKTAPPPYGIHQTIRSRDGQFVEKILPYFFSEEKEFALGIP